MNNIWIPENNSFISDTLIDEFPSFRMQRDSIWQSIGPYNYDVLRCDFGENPEKIYAATREYGVCKTIDGGENWNQINNGINDLFIRSFGVNPFFSNMIFAGTFNNGLYRSINSGQTWDYVNAIEDTTIFDIKFDLNNQGTVYVGTSSKGVYRSCDSGISWQLLTPDSIEISAFKIIIDSSNSNIVYYSNLCDHSVYKSTDYGNSWELFFSNAKNIISFTIDSNNSNNIYMGATGFNPQADSLYKSINGGQFWEKIAIINDIKIITDILIDHINSNKIYIATAEGDVYKSDNFGITWEDFSSGIPAVSVLQLKFQPSSTSTLFAATNGSAIIKIDNFNTGFSDNEIETSNDIFLNQNYPNPFNPTTKIEFSIRNKSNVEVAIYNIKGQKIKTLAYNEFNSGDHSIIWNGEDKNNKPVASGIYYYKLNVNGKTKAVKKCLLLK